MKIIGNGEAQFLRSPLPLTTTDGFSIEHQAVHIENNGLHQGKFKTGPIDKFVD